MAVRPATRSDLEYLTKILVASSNDDPCYPYRFPWKDHYPLQYEEHCRRKCREYLTANTVEVYELTDPRGDQTVIAFSVWDQPKGHLPKSQRSQTWPRRDTLPPPNKEDDRDSEASQHPQPRDHAPRPKQHLVRTPSQPKPFAREDRCRAFRDAGKAAKAGFFENDKQQQQQQQEYATGGGGGGYMFLKILLCHPDYRRRGAGTALVRRGVAVARLHGAHTALFSSPMGVHLYRKLGFQEIGKFEVAVAGDEERLEIPAMVFPARGPAARSRRGSRCAAEVAPTGLRKCSTHNAMVVQKV
ncbi:hypothetical protein NKR19_g1075 [Coniochaeta hoffmannii]|uniref:N-acetyltransferase domain-containing protein n=1 Tax=Coniochaeta hoffmannii TaxID=91930 RepID=A0AA38SJ65_9PEZI|nr:hypothetical protein NKR19_g1075 [Coniochaeta hoffmannii]